MIRYKKLLIASAAIAILYAFFLYGIATNPPGFYVDESCLAYNGYLLAQTGVSESGVSYPLFVSCYTQGYTQYASPTHVYLLAVLFTFVDPSNLSARIFAATIGFSAILLLGVLATRISGRRIVGVIVSISAMLTPWLFELSRLVLETFAFPFAVTLFLYCLYNAYERQRWKLTDEIFLALALALITYSYTIGRLLGPGFALGLIFFAADRRALISVVRTWCLFALTLIPITFIYLTNPAAITGRFGVAANFSVERSFLENAAAIATAYVADIGPTFLILQGDPFVRHHIPGSGQFLVATFALAVLGVGLILREHFGDPWWRFILFGTLFSILPGALTTERYHAFRLLAFPIFFLVLTIPAITWLLSGDAAFSRSNILNDGEEISESRRIAKGLHAWFSERTLRLGLLAGLLVLTAVQAILFRIRYETTGPDRVFEFNAAYPEILDQALAFKNRPIYLRDGDEPAYIHALWYAATKGIDTSNFVHLLDGQSPPEGALVIGAQVRYQPPCRVCTVLSQQGSFLLYVHDPNRRTKH